MGTEHQWFLKVPVLTDNSNLLQFGSYFLRIVIICISYDIFVLTKVTAQISKGDDIAPNRGRKSVQSLKQVVNTPTD